MKTPTQKLITKPDLAAAHEELSERAADIGDVLAADPQSPWEIVCEMEDDVAAVGDFARVVALLAGTLGENATAVQRMAWTIGERVEAIEERRGQLFARATAVAPVN